MILPPPEPVADEPVATKPKGKGKKSKGESWDFEPADASRETAPPEESVVFAEQALNRKQETPSKTKASARRAVIWSLGGLAGLGLLGVSVWLAIASHQTPLREITTRPARSKPQPPTDSATTPSVTTQDSAAAPAVSADAPETDPAPVDPAPTPTAETTAKAPPKGSTSDRSLQARALSPGTSMVPDPSRGSSRPAPAPAPTVAPKMSTVTTAPAGDRVKKPSGDATPPATASSTNAAPAPSVSSSASKDSRPTPPPPKPLKRDDDDMWPTDDPVRPTVSSTPKTSAATTPVATSIPEPKSDPAATPPKTSTPPATTSGTPAPSATATGQAIDRLRLATEKASADQDLAALRQLKTAWKGLLRTAVGKDRARAKREYADCLWDIQAVTGRDADQREALNAYRDYLLSAPAGGADARSAERMRELEDALRERR